MHQISTPLTAVDAILTFSSPQEAAILDPLTSSTRIGEAIRRTPPIASSAWSRTPCEIPFRMLRTCATEPRLLPSLYGFFRRGHCNGSLRLVGRRIRRMVVFHNSSKMIHLVLRNILRFVWRAARRRQQNWQHSRPSLNLQPSHHKLHK